MKWVDAVAWIVVANHSGEEVRIFPKLAHKKLPSCWVCGWISLNPSYSPKSWNRATLPLTKANRLLTNLFAPSTQVEVKRPSEDGKPWLLVLLQTSPWCPKLRGTWLSYDIMASSFSILFIYTVNIGGLRRCLSFHGFFRVEIDLAWLALQVFHRQGTASFWLRQRCPAYSWPFHQPLAIMEWSSGTKSQRKTPQKRLGIHSRAPECNPASRCSDTSPGQVLRGWNYLDPTNAFQQCQLYTQGHWLPNLLVV